MNRWIGIVVFWGILNFLPGCSQPANSSLEFQRIEVGPGPEDMVLDRLSASPRLLISCNARREIHQPYGEIITCDLVTGSTGVLQRTNEPSGLIFNPHGIYLDHNLLYVISHSREPDYHPILRYRVYADSLVFQELISTPLQISPNALVTGNSGEIYFTNDAGKRGSTAEKIFRLKRANVVRLTKDPSSGNWKSSLMAVDLGYPAGINRIGDKIFVGDAILNRIHVYHINGDGLTLVTQLKGFKGNDNIRLHNGQLLVPGHIKPFKFIKHTKDPEQKSPVQVFLIDPYTGQSETLFSTDGESISGGSTSIIFNDHLYICQVFDPFLLQVDLSDN
jgi:hypothetical protein